MTNEEIVEEILIQSFNLKIYNQVIELAGKYNNIPLSEAIQKAYFQITSNVEIIE